MEPQYLKLLKKKKTSHKGIAIIMGGSSFIVSYFFILAPIRQMPNTSYGTGIFTCPYALFFSMIIGFSIMFCAWYLC
jgi:hypothetical protein